MNYFDKNSEVFAPFAEYDAYVIYSIDKANGTAGIEFLFDFSTAEISYYENIIGNALKTAFEELSLNKVYVNVIRDNYKMYDVLHRFNSITEAIHREQYRDDGKHDVVYMTALKREWEDGGISYGCRLYNAG